VVAVVVDTRAAGAVDIAAVAQVVDSNQAVVPVESVASL